MGSARGGEYYISKPRWSSGKIQYTPLATRVWAWRKTFCFWKYKVVNFYIFGGAAKLRWVGGAQRPVGRVNEPNKTGARSARARTRGQNPLVILYLNLGSLYRSLHKMRQNYLKKSAKTWMSACSQIEPKTQHMYNLHGSVVERQLSIGGARV